MTLQWKSLHGLSITSKTTLLLFKTIVCEQFIAPATNTV